MTGQTYHCPARRTAARPRMHTFPDRKPARESALPAVAEPPTRESRYRADPLFFVAVKDAEPQVMVLMALATWDWKSGDRGSTRCCWPRARRLAFSSARHGLSRHGRR